MFEVGYNYEFRMIEGGDEIMFHGVIETYEAPLIKLEDSPEGSLVINGQTAATIPAQSGRIINTSSPNFISAVRQA